MLKSQWEGLSLFTDVNHCSRFSLGFAVNFDVDDGEIEMLSKLVRGLSTGYGAVKWLAIDHARGGRMWLSSQEVTLPL